MQFIICIYCGRKGVRGYRAVHSRDEDFVDQWCCDSDAACYRRQGIDPLSVSEETVWPEHMGTA